jgi:hypothetical protein
VLSNYDQFAPLVVVVVRAPDQADSVTGDSNTVVHFWVLFSNSVSGFAVADVTAGGDTGAHVSAVDAMTGAGNTIYDVSLSGMTADGDITAGVAASVVQDLFGQYNPESLNVANTVAFACQS